MKTMKHLMVISLLCLGIAGCKSPGGNPLVQRTGTVEQILPERQAQQVDTVTNTTPEGTIQIQRITNTVTLPPVFYTNLVYTPLVNNGLVGATQIASVSGVPWATTGVSILGALSAGALGLVNMFQRRKLKGKVQENSLLQDVASELKDNVGTVLGLLAPEHLPAAKQKLQQSQIAAGPDVSSTIKDLIKS